MALKKEIELSNGVSAEYWRIKSFSIFNSSLNVVIAMELWKDQETRQHENKAAIAEHEFVVEIDPSMGIVFSNCYDKLKLLEQFQGAIDV